MTLAGSWSVVGGAHIQAFTFFMCWNSQDHGRSSAMHMSKHSPSHSADTLKITVGCPSSTYPSIRTKTCTRVWLLGPHCKRKKELWARPPVLTPVPSQAIHCRACLNSHHSDIQGTAQKSSTLFEAIAQKKVCHCLGAWDWWSGHGNTGAGQDTQDNGHARQQRDADLRCKAQCDAPLQDGHRRCRRRSWRHVNQLRFRCVCVVFVV